MLAEIDSESRDEAEIAGVIEKILTIRVFPGVELVFARFFLLRREFRMEDFPTFERPAKAIWLG